MAELRVAFLMAPRGVNQTPHIGIVRLIFGSRLRLIFGKELVGVTGIVVAEAKNVVRVVKRLVVPMRLAKRTILV